MDNAHSDVLMLDTPMEFVSAWITDTRLMAVMAMRVDWRIPNIKKVDGPEDERVSGGTEMHQFFYFDTVETGFERFEQIAGSDEDELRAVEASFAGGLGGDKHYLYLEEVVYLVKHFARLNKKFGSPLPEDRSGYAFILNGKVHFSEAREKAMMEKICRSPLGKYERLNYFMMQVANLDEEGIRYLSCDALGKEVCPSKEPGTLYKNDIEEALAEDGSGNGGDYLMESLIETDTGYEIWKSRATLGINGVTAFTRTSYMRISDTEAFMNISHSEFAMVFKFDSSEDREEAMSAFTKRFTRIEEEDGYSYMVFRQNNDHVKLRNYKLYDDLDGIFHVTSTGQLVCSSGDSFKLFTLTRPLMMPGMIAKTTVTGNFEFNEPVMAQFLSSGYDDFLEFVEEITSDE